MGIFFFAFSLFIVSPSLLGYFFKNGSCWYAGHIAYFDPWDINFYLSAIEQGKNGHWLFLNQHTTTPHSPFPAFLSYLFAGKIPFLSHLPSAVILNLWRACLFVSFFSKLIWLYQRFSF